jgi:urea transport system permease protein
VNFGKTYFSESFPELWLFVIGFLFIGVVMLFPNGLAGIELAGIKRVFANVKKRIGKAQEIQLPAPAPSHPVHSHPNH